MKSILVVFTGGTIGSCVSEDSINVVKGQTYRILHDYNEPRKGSIIFDVYEPTNILSENARPGDWLAITRAIREGLRQEHSGVVVTHGTDTLSYCAAALAFALYDIAIPVVLVASDLPLEDADANGPINFRDAIELIFEVDFGGVLVAYRNPDGRRIVHLGSRVLPASPLDHFIHSACGSHIGEFDSSGRLHLGAVKPLYHARGEAHKNKWQDPKFDENVHLIQPYPGLNYERIELSGCSAVVHDLYHSGTACAADITAQSILPFAIRCRDAGIPLFCGPIPLDVGAYESSAEFRSVGIIPVHRMRAEVTYVKVSLGIGLGLQGGDLTDFVCHQEIAGEFSFPAGA